MLFYFDNIFFFKHNSYLFYIKYLYILLAVNSNNNFVGLPDPPSEVQVESGPQDGTLLVTWLPVTTHATDPSNRGHITGYAVYADGKKVSDIDSPTG